MKRRADRQHDAALGASLRGNFNGTLDRCFAPAHDDLTRGVVICQVAYVAGLASRQGIRRDGFCFFHGWPHKCGHRTFAYRDRFLHCRAAQLKQARGVCQAQGACPGQRGILPKRMARDVRCDVRQSDVTFLFYDADDGDAERHQGRLGVFGQTQVVVGAFEYDLG